MTDLEEAVAELRKAQDGSLYGWVNRGEITALIAIYTEGDDPEACFSVMPRDGVPEDQWPPFASEPLFGSWFWEHCEAGRIVDLGPVIGDTQRVVFWSGRDVPPEAGAGVIAVRYPLAVPDGLVLPAGVYIYYCALRAGADAPPLGEVLADPQRIGLGPRFAGYRGEESALGA